jgi:hypothetical protein
MEPLPLNPPASFGGAASPFAVLDFSNPKMLVRLHYDRWRQSTSPPGSAIAGKYMEVTGRVAHCDVIPIGKS